MKPPALGRSGHPRRERQGEEQDEHRPRRDDEPRVAHDEPAETIEGAHRASSYAAAGCGVIAPGSAAAHPCRAVC